MNEWAWLCLTLFNSNHDDHVQHLTLKSSPITVAAILYSAVFQFFRCFSYKFCPILIKIGSYDLWTEPHRNDWRKFLYFGQKLWCHELNFNPKLVQTKLGEWDMPKLGTVPPTGHDLPQIDNFGYNFKTICHKSWSWIIIPRVLPNWRITTLPGSDELPVRHFYFAIICNLLNNLTDEHKYGRDHWQHVVEVPEKSEQSAT